MSTLADRLDRLREGFRSQVPEETLGIMDRATADLRASGILGGIPSVGSELPPFSLENTEGEDVRSEDLLARGPLVLTLYRGVW